MVNKEVVSARAEIGTSDRDSISDELLEQRFREHGNQLMEIAAVSIRETLQELRIRRLLRGGSAKTTLLNAYTIRMIQETIHPHLFVNMNSSSGMYKSMPLLEPVIEYVALPDLSARALRMGVHLSSCQSEYHVL